MSEPKSMPHENPYVSPLDVTTAAVTQAKSDYDHLRWLSMAYYVVGALSGICACFPIVYSAIGIGFLMGAFDDPKNPNGPPHEFGWFFILISGVLVAAGWALAIALLATGRMLSRYEGYTFCFVVAVIAILMVQPFGTVLGIFTIIVLMRPSVKGLFEGRPAAR